jgi:hypothetical protein
VNTHIHPSLPTHTHAASSAPHIRLSISPQSIATTETARCHTDTRSEATQKRAVVLQKEAARDDADMPPHSNTTVACGP